MKNIKKYIPVIVVVAVALVLVAGSALYMGKIGSGSNKSANEVGEEVVDYINNTLLQGQASVTLSGTPEKDAKYNLYKIKFSLQGQEIVSYATMDGKLFFPEAFELSSSPTDPASNNPSNNQTSVGGFYSTGEEAILENGKPVVYFFGSESCPHCTWEEPIITEVAESFGGLVSFHSNIDTDKDQDVFLKYNPGGGVPTIVIAGKYFRVGSGENFGQEQEKDFLTAYICKVTNNQPTNVCSAVQELINNIES